MCKTAKVESSGRSRAGKQVFKRLCTACRKKPYTQHKKTKCESCGFIPVHRVQLDVDHIDGNHNNNDLNNLQTLCANCHRLKTHIDYLEKFN